MLNKKELFLRIKKTVLEIEPKATVIIYGSYARGTNKKSSDVDILILIDKDFISFADKKNISYPLYEIEFETGQIISPLVLSKKEWETKHRITPFYENIKKDGILL